MLSNETMNAVADMVAKEPHLAKQVAAIQDPDKARELLRRMAAERGIAWREEPLRHALPDDQLEGVSGGWTDADREAERKSQLERLAECRKIFYMMPGVCTMSADAVRSLS